MLDAVSSDSRRGSLVPPGSRRGSRQGSISLAGTERRGSYYGDDVSKRATVAVVVDGDKGKMNGEGKIIPISIIQTIFTINNFTGYLSWYFKTWKIYEHNILGGVINGQGRFSNDSSAFAKNLLLDYARFACLSPTIQLHIATNNVTDLNKFP